MQFVVEHNGKEVRFDADPQAIRAVSWMDDWTVCDELVTRGIFRRIHRGPATYGHCDYYLNDGTAYRVVEPETVEPF